MKSISIRDDDINFYTNAGRLREIYEPMFAYVKPTLCVTPYAGRLYWEVRQRENELLGTAAKCAFVQQFVQDNPQLARETMPVWENGDLIALLKDWVSTGRVDLALHGITHNPTMLGYECDSTRPDPQRLRRVLNECKAAFGVDIKVFSPPNNSINREWFDAVAALDMNIVHSAGLKPWEAPLAFNSLISCSRIIIDRLLRGRASRVHRVLPFGRLRLVPSIPTLPFTELQGIHGEIERMAASVENILVIATHSYAFDYDADMLPRLMAVVKHAREQGFVPLGLGDVLGGAS